MQNQEGAAENCRQLCWEHMLGDPGEGLGDKLLLPLCLHM